jgi:hypothetical protein
MIPCYALAALLHEIIYPLVGKIETWVKNSDYFLQLLKSVCVRESDILVSFDVVSLSTSVLVDEVLDIIRNELREDDTLAERSVLGVDTTMQLLEVC